MMKRKPVKKGGHMAPTEGAVAQLGMRGPSLTGMGAGQARHVNAWIRNLEMPGDNHNHANFKPLCMNRKSRIVLIIISVFVASLNAHETL